MSHSRVVNVRARGASWDVYVGRGRCPATGKPGHFGNPFSVAEHGIDAMRLYVDRLAGAGPEQIAAIRRALAGKVLGCWCAPRLCHGEVLARLADGDPLDAIRADVLAAAEARQAPKPKAQAGPGPLFAPGGSP